MNSVCVAVLFPEKIDKMLPKPRFCKPIFCGVNLIGPALLQTVPIYSDVFQSVRCKQGLENGLKTENEKRPKNGKWPSVRDGKDMAKNSEKT